MQQSTCYASHIRKSASRTAQFVFVAAIAFLALLASVSTALGQAEQSVPSSRALKRAGANSEQVARIIGVEVSIQQLRLLHSQRSCGSAASLEELSARQDILETVVATSFDVDGVLAEIGNESAQLAELQARLQTRRDRAVNLANVANLVTGTGVGIAVNALQFSTSTANVGNSLGVGSGIGSTVLSIIGIRKQRGPQHSVGRIPNMLAPLFERPAVLNAGYPPEVLEYLRSVPPGESADRRSRLDQLMAEWAKAGRIGPPGAPKVEQKVILLTASMDDHVKLSIDDLSDRIAMLSDVAGRVSLMKRDLAELMLSERMDRNCTSK